MPSTPKQKAAANVGYWAAGPNKIKLQAGVFSFKNREYQIEPMTSNCRRRCYMKATQLGFTEMEVLRALHAMIFKYLPKGVLYMFPNTDAVREFGKSRFDPLIAANRYAIGRYVKPAGKGTDTASLKKIGDAFLFLRGARLSHKISQQDESIQMIGIPVDRLVFDEVDKMSKKVIAKARGRLGDSDIKEEVFIANPLVPDDGIDEIFQDSDQRYWFRKCRFCGKFTCAEKFFMEDPERCVGTRQDGTGYIACHNCGRELLIDWFEGESLTSEWVPDVKANTDYMQGYQLSQLTSIKNDPLEILHQYRNPPERNLGDIIRLRLGFPWIGAEDRLTSADVYNCCNGEEMHSHSAGPCCMGVDVGDTKHVVIGQRINREQYQVLKVIQLTSWQDIGDIARRFNVRSAVIDMRPLRDAAADFQSKQKYPVFLCEYSDNPAFMRLWDTKKGVVKDYRTALFDETHRMVVTPGMLTIPRKTNLEIQEFVKQMCNPYKILEISEKTGAKAFRYRGKNDHYRNAMNYFLLAAQKSGVARAGGKKKKQKFAISDYNVLGVN